MNYLVFTFLLIVTLFFTLFSFMLPPRANSQTDINITWRLAFAILAVGLWFVLALSVATIDFPGLYVAYSNYTYSGSNVASVTYTVATNIYRYEAATFAPLLFMGIGIMQVVYVFHLAFSILQNAVKTR